MVKADLREPTRIRSVGKAVAILVWLAGQPEARSAKQIATALGLPIATAYHLLDTLAQDGMLFKDERRLYHLGPSVGLMVDAFQRQNSPPEYLLAPLRRLAEAVGETTYLSAAEGLDVVVVASVEGSHAVRVRGLHVGFRGALHARGSGKLILAYAGDERIESYLARILAPRTPHTILDPGSRRSARAATPSTRRSSPRACRASLRRFCAAACRSPRTPSRRRPSASAHGATNSRQPSSQWPPPPPGRSPDECP
jgi:DNA-binding IclR family transcriptional regulator